MKILFLLPALDVGGLERVQVTLANALSRRGHEVTVMIYGSGDELSGDLDSNVRFIKKPPKPHPIMSKIPYVRNRFYDDGMWENRASAGRLHKYYIGNEKYDVEIAFFRGLSIKTISGFTADDTVHLAWVHTDFRKATGYMYHFKNMKQVFDAYNRFNKIVCVSEQAQEGFKQTVGDTENLTTIYNLLPVSEIKAKATEKPALEFAKHDFNLVLVGRLLDSAKGQIRLINAVCSLQNEGIDVGLTLVGSGVDEDIIKKHIAERNAQSFVNMTGNQLNPYPYIAQSDLLVCSSFFEGYNLTVAEALIIGIPVLSTRCTGPVEILEDGEYGMIVDNSEQGIIDGLRSIITDKQLYAHYKNAAGKRTDFFNEEKILRDIEKLFEKGN